MENLTIASGPAISRPPVTRLLRAFGLVLGVVAVLVVNSGDRAFMASTSNLGIDPLQILDTGVRNNILFVVGTSEGMADTPQLANSLVGGDDPASRFYQVKQAVRSVITANQGQANFGLATFQPESDEHGVDIANTAGLVYVSQDNTAENMRNNFTAPAAISAVNIQLGSVANQTNNSSTITGQTWTPITNTLVMVFIIASRNNAPSDPTTVTGHGLTFTKVTLTANTLGTDHAMSVWVAKAVGTVTNTATQATWGSNRNGAQMIEYTVRGADLNCTPSPMCAIVQQPTTTGTGTTASTALATPGSIQNGAIYFVGHLPTAADDTTPAAGWTEGADTGFLTPTTRGHVQSIDLIPATASATWPLSAIWRGVAIEVKAGPALTLVDTCATSTCTSAESSAIFSVLTSNDTGTSTAYPTGCTLQSSDQVAVGGSVNTAIPHVLGTHCRYYIRSKLMINGRRYSVARGATSIAAIKASASITCPAPPPGLLGNDTADANDGSQNRACFQIQDVTSPATNKITTYWLTSPHFRYNTVTNPGSTPAKCFESGIKLDVADCGVDAVPSIRTQMRLQLQYDTSTGLPLDVPAVTNLQDRTPQSSAYQTPAYQNVGLRLGSGAPLAKSLDMALNYFRTTILPAAGTLKRPAAAQGKQKQYVVLIVAGDDSCSTLSDVTTAATNLWNNTLPTLSTCTGTCLTSKGLTAAQWAAANRIELIVVPYGGTQSSMTAIAQAGSGGARSAPIATSLTELRAALNKAVFVGASTGEFSDQQSVTETVFEFASLATPSKDPLDPYERYAVSVPVLLQSTFEMPDFTGHLNAFRRGNSGTTGDLSDDASVQEWDAGQKLQDRVSNATTGMGTAAYLFEDLYGNATPQTIKTSTAKIKRRVYTTTRNGVNNNYTVSNLLSTDILAAGNVLTWTRVPLWPPTSGTTSNSFVAPTATFASSAAVTGILDTAMGFDAWTTVAAVQAAVPGVCQGSVTADIHADCTSATAGLPLARAKREAREIILAYIAGARVKTVNGLPVRTTSNPTRELQYEIRPWIMAESTLAAPGVVTPPLLAGPVAGTGAVGVEEYKAYRDGLRNATTFAPVNGIMRGLGLRNPDRVDPTATDTVIDAAKEDINLKPSMSVVYHSTNQGLHAFRAGPCPTPPSGSGISSLTIPCSGETGGEELWAFVPFDLLPKLPALTQAQTRGNKQYLLASPVRFADIFVPGTGSFGGQSFTGVWRTILYFGRGAGGKYLTAIDVTTPGPFTKHSLTTSAPIVVWSRGNPDTNSGAACGSGTHNNSVTSTDCPTYAKMGETWSVPAVGFVTAASYTTSRTGLNGTNFALFVGSGFSDVSSEGKTFFVLDALNGDIIRSFDIANGTVPSQSPALTNFLVASPVGYTEDNAGNSPTGYNFIGNPIATKTKTVYFGDIHGRIWRYNATTPATAPAAFYTVNTSTDGNQPFATAVSVLQNKQSDTDPADLYVFAESGFDRRVAIDTTKPFKGYAFKDVSGTREDVFKYDFPANYRGSVQPASGFAGSTTPLTPVVFFAATKFNTGCVPTFDSILVALRATVISPGVPDAAFDLRATGDDAFLEMTGKRINAIRVSGEGSLVIDQGLNAQDVPPPPGVAVPSVVIPGSSSIVRTGLTPGTQDYKDLVATTEPYRVGSSVCRTQ